MTDMRHNSKPDSVCGQIFGGGASTNPAAVFSARVFGDGLFTASRAMGVYLTYTCGKVTDVFLVEFFAAQQCLPTSQLAL